MALTDEQLKQLTTWIPPEMAREAAEAGARAAVMAVVKVFYAASRDFDSYSKVKIQSMCEDIAKLYTDPQGVPR